MMDWNSDDGVVFRSYGSVAIYKNKHDDLVLVQERGQTDDEDSTVVVAKEHVELLMLAIRDLMKVSI